ncbi:hypothetical protein [Aureimonas sp. AU40]|uniref:hypothetical protein n=1 Tax=Aureimonas sp. AU40 TaxID=1637747 RepID=UPI0007819199|nr:hypothetical protein [Aureimonas sp. AU40]
MIDDEPRAPATRTITMKEEDVHFFYLWSKLDPDQKQALNDAAKILGEDEAIDSFRDLIRNGKKLMVALRVFETIGMVRDFIIKVSAAIAAIGVIAAAIAHFGAKP